jgi:hypothetical protein
MIKVNYITYSLESYFIGSVKSILSAPAICIPAIFCQGLLLSSSDLSHAHFSFKAADGLMRRPDQTKLTLKPSINVDQAVGAHIGITGFFGIDFSGLAPPCTSALYVALAFTRVKWSKTAAY